MYNITLICTRHHESGNCNSEELLKFIDSIRPDLIFEELSHANYNECYCEKSLFTLETNSVKKYLKYCPVTHIPVDTYDIPKDHYKDVDQMYDKICNSISIEMRNFKALIDQQCNYTEHYGFRFLNGESNDILNEHIASRKEKVLAVINNERLFEIRKREIEVFENREEEMLRNIYDYSKINTYEQAIFFIGSGHRKSIIEKIKNFNRRESLKLNWNFL